MLDSLNPSFRKVFPFVICGAAICLAQFFTACGDDSSSSARNFAGVDKDGMMKDSRDGQTYRTVTIGSQTWMAENLNYKTEDSYCYNDSAEYCEKYGRLYLWNAALKACPSGWHLPLNDEFEVLIAAVGDSYTAGQMLKSTSGWSKDGEDDGNGTDAYSFSALPAGYGSIVDGVDFGGEGYDAEFWSLIESGGYYIYVMSLGYSSNGVHLEPNGTKESLSSVRCIMDEVEVVPETVSIDSVKEGVLEDSRDGQTYRTVTIGTQTWMAENLNCNSYGSSCYAEDPDSCFKYGRLYDGGENAKAACPPGWHLPTIEEFKTLFAAVGGMNLAGKELRSNDGYATDSYLFSALSAGCMVENGGIGSHPHGAGEYVWFKTASGYYVRLDKDEAVVGSIDSKFACNKFSVRCVLGEDPSVEPSSCAAPQPQNKHEGRVDPSTVVVDSFTDSRDNQTYRMVTIGTQTWMGENLNYETAESRCYACETYGRIYRWDDAQTACPLGWHLPTKSELETLVEAVGGQYVGGKMLKSTELWAYDDDEKEGSDAYSFTALPAGQNVFEFDEGELHGEDGLRTAFWSSSEADSSLAYALHLAFESREAVFDSNSKRDGFSVRCLKD